MGDDSQIADETRVASLLHKRSLGVSATLVPLSAAATGAFGQLSVGGEALVVM